MYQKDSTQCNTQSAPRANLQQATSQSYKFLRTHKNTWETSMEIIIYKAPKTLSARSYVCHDLSV